MGPKASIIVISHNNLNETTKPCLESVFAKTSGSFEVISVDNASTDGTKEYLRALAAREPRLILVLNETNKGFAAGNNDGIRAAKGSHLVLLNSDTLVTEGWLEKLMAVLEKDKSVGLAGPVSNSVGNEQQIDIEGTGVEAAMKEGALWCRMSRGDFFETGKLGFFCVAMRRDALDKIGLLDEGYGLGYYEDDDYCVRARRAGYRLICAEDVFIYHKGGGSFTDSRLTRELMRKNRKLLETKLGCSVSGRHTRDLQLDLVKSCIEKAKISGLTTGLGYKIENRLRAAARRRPRGLFKRTIFDFKVRALTRSLERLKSVENGFEAS